MKFIAKYLSREVRYLITGLVAGFLFCFCLWAMVVTATAAEPDAPESSESVVIVSEAEIVQDEQLEVEEAARSEPEPVAEVVQDAEMEVDESTSTPEPEAPAQLSAQSYIEIQPFASGAVVGVLVDLLQDNVIENDGYTDESWQRYESAMAAGWNVIANFMTYTNDDVQTVIDELIAAVAGLEYPAGSVPEHPIITGIEGLDVFAREAVTFSGFLGGLLSVLTVSGGMRNAT